MTKQRLDEIKTEGMSKETSKGTSKGTQKNEVQKNGGVRKKVWIGILILFLISLPGYYCGLTVRVYQVKNAKIQGKLRIALVTDLHSCKYGKGQKKLLDAIEKQQPDVILLGGDIFDDKLSDARTEEFLAGISGRYPCYYVTGNHECWAGTEAFQVKMELLKKYGILRLAGDVAELSTGSGEVLLCGVDDPHVSMVRSTDAKGQASNHQKELSDIGKELRETSNMVGNGVGLFTILLTHRPELVTEYEQGGFDLVLAGHAHGGQVRIPGILNGLYAPNQGLFPKYAGGRYDLEGMTMIVSRGLARESTLFPRFFNPPELVIVELSGED